MEGVEEKLQAAVNTLIVAESRILDMNPIDLKVKIMTSRKLILEALKMLKG